MTDDERKRKSEMQSRNSTGSYGGLELIYKIYSLVVVR